MTKEDLKYMTIKEVALTAQTSVRHVAEEIKRKNLRAFKPGKRLLFDPEDVQKWIKKKAVA
ncbi:MAG: helix-turn-helix domain-containing protein [Nitrosomonas sp.]|nr:helix-turn-helix domain-containing protein [Nitrosomonas sp.]